MNICLSSAGFVSRYGSLLSTFGRAYFSQCSREQSSLKEEPTAPSPSIRSIRSLKPFLRIPSTHLPGPSKLWTTGANHDTLLTVGWLDLGKGPQILHVPDMAGRYYSVQLKDPSKNENFAYNGKRTTGTGAGEYLVSGPRWKGTVPQGMPQISSPHNSVLVIGRILVYSDSDLPTAYDLAKQIQVAPLTIRQPSH
jgi:hypothetical protein